MVTCGDLRGSSRTKIALYAVAKNMPPFSTLFSLHSQIGNRLVFEEVFGEEENVGGAFGEAAHEVGIPLRAEGDIDTDAVALGGEATLEVAADTVEHLEFKGVLVDFVLVDEVAHLVDDGFV